MAKKLTTKKRSWFVQKLYEMGACSEAIRYAKKHRTFPAAWQNCNNRHWMLWLLSRLEIWEHDFRVTQSACLECNGTEAKVRRRFAAERVAKALRAK